MKTPKIPIIFVLAYIAILGACFSPWGGNENTDLKYTITLTSGDQSIEVDSHTIPIVITVPHGTWEVEVRADATESDDFAATSLRFVGKVDVTVSGDEEKITLDTSSMTPAIQVENWSHVSNAFKKWGDYLNKVGWKPKNNAQECYIEIISNNPQEKIQADTTATLNEDRNITMWTKKDVTLNRSSNLKTPLFQIEKGALTLGGNEPDQGKIIIDGNKEATTGSKDSLIKVSGGALIMNEGVTITNNTTTSHGGGVFVENGEFTMKGGEISHNTSIPTSSTGNAGGGGGVFVDNGEFIMKGGSIHHNTTEGHGGGVRVYTAGKFVMEGGKIHDNNSKGFGGGVRVRGTFTMTGGEIYDNHVKGKDDKDNPGHGGGVGVADTGSNSSGSFFMEGGIIRGNTANDGHGGGVFKGPAGTFTQNGGTIVDNKPDQIYRQ
jgi:hypothetical protein